MTTYAGAARHARRSRRTEEAVSLVARVDWLLLGASLGLVGFGLWAIAGITRHDIPGDPSYYLVHQAVFAGAGLAALAFVVVAVLFFLIGHGTLHWAEQIVPSGVAALLVATEPLWIAILMPSRGRSRTRSVRGRRWWEQVRSRPSSSSASSTSCQVSATGSEPS